MEEEDRVVAPSYTKISRWWWWCDSAERIARSRLVFQMHLSCHAGGKTVLSSASRRFLAERLCQKSGWSWLEGFGLWAWHQIRYTTPQD